MQNILPSSAQFPAKILLALFSIAVLTYGVAAVAPAPNDAVALSAEYLWPVESPAAQSVGLLEDGESRGAHLFVFMRLDSRHANSTDALALNDNRQPPLHW
jgi:hypothetical protein